MAQPSDSLSTNTFADRLQLGSVWSRPGWEATTTPKAACFREQGPLLPPWSLFINSWLMSPSPHKRKLSKVIVKMRAAVNQGESSGEMFELGIFSLAKWRGECCCSERTIKNTKYRLSGASDVVLLHET